MRSWAHISQHGVAVCRHVSSWLVSARQGEYTTWKDDFLNLVKFLDDSCRSLFGLVVILADGCLLDTRRVRCTLNGVVEMEWKFCPLGLLFFKDCVPMELPRYSRCRHEMSPYRERKISAPRVNDDHLLGCYSDAVSLCH